MDFSAVLGSHAKHDEVGLYFEQASHSAIRLYAFKVERYHLVAFDERLELYWHVDIKVAAPRALFLIPHPEVVLVSRMGDEV